MRWIDGASKPGMFFWAGVIVIIAACFAGMPLCLPCVAASAKKGVNLWLKRQRQPSLKV
jgi:hypothetical protein